MLYENVTPNCSVKMSSLYGDIHDEQEGSPTGGPGQSGAQRKDHEWGRGPGVAAERPAVSAAEGAGADRGRRGAAASQSGAGLAASAGGGGGQAGGAADDDGVRGLQR